MKFSKPIAVTVLLAAIVLLTACGGGGSSSVQFATFDGTEFYGTWIRNDATASGNTAHCFNFNTYGGTFGGLNRPSVITQSTITDTVEVYSDTTCSTYLGLLVRTYSVTWSAGSVTGKTNVARALVTSTGYSIDRDGAPGYSISSYPALGVVSKSIFDVNGVLLYIGSPAASLDADGYPTALQSTALYTR